MAKQKPGFLSKEKKDIGVIIIPAVFFLFSGFVFKLFSVDFSPLFLAVLFYVYARYMRKIEKLPAYIDLLILTGLAAVLFLSIKQWFLFSAVKPERFILNALYGGGTIFFVLLVMLLFENLELSLLFSFFASALAGSIEKGDFTLTISLFSAALCTSLLCYRIRRRSQIINAGTIGGLAFFLIRLVVEDYQSFSMISISDFSFLLSIGREGLAYALCGLGGALLVNGALPIGEYVFKTVTSISLLELSDFNHPLLRKMILEAPGTYQHSLVVANLAESAAESIGANPLLARVGAYYHDIGKMTKSNYFVENLMPYRDAHKDLKPSISKMIIMNHVKEGVDMALKHRLNPRIIDFIQQHHGKSLVYYFYHRAKELEPDKEREYQEEYRYPGPRPQSREVAIVSLADAIEALSRTLEEPTPSRLEEMVREVVRKKFFEGELDESNLTLRDLERITRSFVRVLNAIFHTRINYPKDESTSKKSAKTKED